MAALENSVIAVLILLSLRNLRMTIRASFALPYVMMCTIYSILFVYSFAALGNLGLIARERTLLFPFFLVLLCIPRHPAAPSTAVSVGTATQGQEAAADAVGQERSPAGSATTSTRRGGGGRWGDHGDRDRGPDPAGRWAVGRLRSFVATCRCRARYGGPSPEASDRAGAASGPPPRSG